MNDLAKDIAQLYLQKYPNPNEAFKAAEFERYEVLEELVEAGANVNFDIDAPNKMNMFHWCAVGPRRRNADFVRILIKYGRKDLLSGGQDVLNLACYWGHCDIAWELIRYGAQQKHTWNIEWAANQAIFGRQVHMLHQLLLAGLNLYEQRDKFLETAILADDVKIIDYIVQIVGIEPTVEQVLYVGEHCFVDSFALILDYYLRSQKPFPITVEQRTRIAGHCHAKEKIKLLQEHGFTVEGYEEFMAAPAPAETKRRYTVLSSLP